MSRRIIYRDKVVKQHRRLSATALTAGGGGGGSTFSASLSEAASATDTLSPSNNTFNVSLTAAATATDTLTPTSHLTAVLTAAASATDTTNSTLDTFDVSLTEAATASDTLTPTSDLIASLTAAGSAADTLDPSGSDYNTLLSEAGAAADSTDSNAIYPVSLTGAATAGDAMAGVRVYARSLNEPASAADSISGTDIRPLHEAANAADVLTTQFFGRPPLIDALSAGDSFDAPSSTYFVDIEEPAFAIDGFAPPAAAIVDQLTQEFLIQDPPNTPRVDQIAQEFLIEVPPNIPHTDQLAQEFLLRDTINVELIEIADNVNDHWTAEFPSIIHGLRFWGYGWAYGKYPTLAVWCAGLDLGDHPISPDGSVFVPWACDAEKLFTAAWLFNTANNPPKGGFGASACNVDLMSETGERVRIVVDAALGLPYKSRLQILRPNLPQQARSPVGPTLATTRRLHQFGARLNNTQSLSVGTSEDNLRPITFTDNAGNPTSPHQLFTGTKWSTIDDPYGYDSMIMMEMFRPYPATVAAIIGFMRTFHRE